MSIKRRCIKKYSYRKRFLGISAADNVKIHQVKHKIAMFLVLSEDLPPEIALSGMVTLFKEYKSLVYEPDYHLEPPPALRRRTIDSYSESDVPHSFRFRSTDQLSILLRLLQFPPTVVLLNGSVLSGEEVFLFGLRRLSYPSRYHDLIDEFGGEFSVWSRAFHYFVNHIYNKFKHLVLNGLQHFVSEFPAFSEVLRSQLIGKGCTHLVNERQFRIIGFIDNTIFATSRPGGGPVSDGVDVPRHDSNIQEAFYTGWKHLHGVKIQTITLPNGLLADVFGPVSVRHNDLYTLSESNINERLSALQEGVYQQKYSLYGDSAYTNIECITSRHAATESLPLTNIEVLENTSMSSIRESIEHVHADIKNKFAFVCYPRGLQLRKKPEFVGKLIVVAAILTNCYKCLYACQTASRFLTLPPTIEEYLSM